MTFNLFGMQINVKKEIFFAVIIVVVVIAGFAGYMIFKSDKDIIIEAGAEASATTPGPAPASAVPDASAPEAPAVADEIKVYVVGCVNKPGIVTLKKGQLIDDAIRLSGGASKDADLANINLVYELKENVMLYIKSAKEIKQQANTAAGGGEAGKGATVTKDSGGAVVNDNSQAEGTKGKVNINTASLSELDTLPGIGAATARDIIAYREKNGLFKSIQDIMKVPRIKESRFANIKDFITID